MLFIGPLALGLLYQPRRKKSNDSSFQPVCSPTDKVIVAAQCERGSGQSPTASYAQGDPRDWQIGV
jgi:hypothetical protein